MQNSVISSGSLSAPIIEISEIDEICRDTCLEIMKGIRLIHINGGLGESIEATRAHKAKALLEMYGLYEKLVAHGCSEEKINDSLDLWWTLAGIAESVLVEGEDNTVTKNEVAPISWTGCIAQLNRQTGIPALDQMVAWEKAAFFVDARRCKELEAATGSYKISGNPFTAMLFEENDPGYLERTINAWTHIGEGQEPVEMDFKRMAALNEMAVGHSALRQGTCKIRVDALDMSKAGLEQAFSDLQWINEKSKRDPGKGSVILRSGGFLLEPKDLDSCKKDRELLGLFVQPLPPDVVEGLFKEIIADMQASLKQCNSEDEQMAAIVHAFQKYELLHPHNDGNTRSAILGINQICKERKLPPFLLDDPNAIDYLSAGELVERSKAFQKFNSIGSYGYIPDAPKHTLFMGIDLGKLSPTDEKDRPAIISITDDLMKMMLNDLVDLESKFPDENDGDYQKFMELLRQHFPGGSWELRRQFLKNMGDLNYSSKWERKGISRMGLSKPALNLLKQIGFDVDSEVSVENQVWLSLPN